MFDDENLVASASIADGQVPGGEEPRSQSGDRCLSELRERVVRTGGQRDDRHLAAHRGHEAVSAVAAEHHEHAGTESYQGVRRRDRVGRSAVERQVEELHPRPGWITRWTMRLDRVGQAAGNAASVGRHHDPMRSDGTQ